MLLLQTKEKVSIKKDSKLKLQLKISKLHVEKAY